MALPSVQLLRTGWYGRVWLLALPMIISNISVPLLGVVDTAVVGHLSEPYHLGAVAIGSMIFNFIYWGFGFLRMGTSGFTAQAFGAGNMDEVRSTGARAMIIGMAAAATLLLLQIPLAFGAFWIVEASDQVEDLARQYFFIRIWAAPAALANYILLGWFLGMQNTRAAMWMQIWMNGLNVVLDLIFVLEFGWGVAGVAWATAISEYAAVGFGAVVAFRMLRNIGGKLERKSVFDVTPLRRMLSVNRDIFLRTICLVFAFAYFTVQGAKFGDVTLAANHVLLNFQLFMAHGLDGFAHAIQALAGGAIGARNRAAFRGAVVSSTVLAGIVAIGFTVVYLAFGPSIIAGLTDIEDVRTEASLFLPWSVVMPIVAVWAFQLDGIFIGATQGKAMRNAMIWSLAVYVGASLILVPLWQNHGLWLALMLFMAVRGVTLGLRYPRLERGIGAESSPP